MKYKVIIACLLLGAAVAPAQQTLVVSPNEEIAVALFNRGNDDSGEWFLSVGCYIGGTKGTAIPDIRLGLVRSDQSFSKQLEFIAADKPSPSTSSIRLCTASVAYAATWPTRWSCISRIPMEAGWT